MRIAEDGTGIRFPRGLNGEPNGGARIDLRHPFGDETIHFGP